MFKKKKTTNIKILFCDIDGTMTDGKMYYTKEKKLIKTFHTRDAKGFDLLKEHNVKIVLITGDQDYGISIKRAKDLGITLHSNIKWKWKLIKEHYLNLYKLEEMAYIGDDVNDYVCLQKIPLSACPKDAALHIKKIKGIKVLKNKGGEGCVREFIDNFILK